MNLRRLDDSNVQIAFNEVTSLVDLDEIIEIFADLKGKNPGHGFLTQAFYENRKFRGVPQNLKRTSSFMTQP